MHALHEITSIELCDNDANVGRMVLALMEVVGMVVWVLMEVVGMVVWVLMEVVGTHYYSASVSSPLPELQTASSRTLEDNDCHGTVHYST